MVKHIVLFVVILLASCTKQQPRRPISKSSQKSFFEQSKALSKALFKQETEAIKRYLAKDSLTKYTTSNYGFWYTYNTKLNDTLKIPKKGDVVTFSYNIANLKDSLIYSKKDLGIKTYRVDEEDFITGLQRGIKLIKVGETVTFIIPSYNAFGLYGDGNKIGINTPIKTTVTLISIN